MRMGLGAAALMLLSACDAAEPVSTKEVQSSEPVKQASPPQKRAAFSEEWIPEAKGNGNFEVCLTTEADENEVKDVTLPAGMLFDSSVPLNGSLRDHEVELSQAKLSSDNWAAGRQSAVSLTKAARLTASHPCAITVARVVLNEGFRYRNETVKFSDHYLFSTEGSYINGSGGISTELKGRAGEVAQIGVIVGTPVADIADAYTAPDDN